MILHFFGKKGNLRTIHRINYKNSNVVCIVLVFLSSRALARRRRPCEPFPRSDWGRNPSFLRPVPGYVHKGHPTLALPASQRPTSQGLPSRLSSSASAAPARYISHVCRPTAASVFIYALIFFHNIRSLGTLETVCVIDDKTKYSAWWFPYFWRIRFYLLTKGDWRNERVKIKRCANIPTFTQYLMNSIQ
jgi:hypothetical protein